MRSRREALMIFGIGPLGRRHAADDRLHAIELLSSTAASASFICPAPGSMPSRLPIGPILRMASICSRKSSSVSSPRADLGGGVLGLLGVEDLLGLLDEAEHVAHAEDAAGHPVGVEDVEVLELLAGGREQDRHAGDLAHRQRRTAAGVAVELGQHHTGEADTLTERLGGGDGVLADHRVEDEHHLVRLDGVADRAAWPSTPRRCRGGPRCRR